MGLLYTRVPKEGPTLGDHIYAWTTAYVHASLGIFVGDNTVIHFTATGTAAPANCPHSGDGDGDGAVLSSCLACFLSGGVLYRFEYSVCPASADNICSLAPSAPAETVVHRAKYLLENGSGCYNVFKNNREDFAIYCKTGLLLLDLSLMGPSGEEAPIVGGPLAAVLTAPFRLVTANAYGMVATPTRRYHMTRFADGWWRHLVKLPVEDLTRTLAAGLKQVVESQITAPPMVAP